MKDHDKIFNFKPWTNENYHKKWFYESFVIFPECDLMDFTITRTKSYFWGGVHHVDPPKTYHSEYGFIPPRA